MKASKRASYNIVAEILNATKGGAFKTHIMYKVRLSYSQLENYLSMLVEKGLVKNTNTGHARSSLRPRITYRTTGKGTQLLIHLEQIDTLLQRLTRE